MIPRPGDVIVGRESHIVSTAFYQIEHDGELTTDDIRQFRAELFRDNLPSQGATLILSQADLDSLSFDWFSQTVYAGEHPEIAMSYLFGFGLVVPTVRTLTRKEKS